MHKFTGTDEFFKSLDSYLGNNLKEFTCGEICDIYSTMYNGLQDFKGNANGFTGLSELIIFRYLVECFGGEFKPKPIEGSVTLKEFSNGTYTVGQSCRIIVNGKRKYPDIVIKKNDEVITVIQIKVYVTNGVEEAENEISDFELFKSKYSKMRGGVIVFTDYGEDSKIRKAFEEFKKQNAWFKIIMLKNNNNNFYDEIKDIIE